MKALRYLNKYLYKYRLRLAIGTLFIIVANALSVIPAQIVRYAVDVITEYLQLYNLYEESNQRKELYTYFIYVTLVCGGAIVLLALLRGVFLFFQRQTIIVVSRLIEYDLKNEIYRHYQTLPLSFYRKNNTGDLMARISEDVSRVRMYLGPAIMYFITLLTLFIMVIGYMITVNVKLTLFTLLPLPFLSVSIYWVNNLINKRSEKIQKSLSNLSTFAQEAFSGIRVIKSFVKEEGSGKNFSNESEHYKKQSMKLTLVNSLFFPLIISLVGLSTIFTIYIGGLEVAEGHITTGVIAEFVIYVNMLTWPVASLGWITSMTQRAEASQERINEFLKSKTDILSSKNIEKEIEGAIDFENVTLIYPESGIKALANINFSIQKGESVALVGATGSGKSTLANLICRLYDPSEGRILIDGVDVKDYRPAYLRSKMGYVPQDVFLFSESIRNNIAFGADRAAEGEIVRAAKDSGVYDNIMNFPQGFDTIIGERGVTLSGGQKQRISIARALIRNPKILILDDCLSAVDTKTENEILIRLKKLMADRTSLIISHRASSVKLADRILVLDEGSIAEQGTHEELMAVDGIYKNLYETQLKVEETEV